MTEGFGPFRTIAQASGGGGFLQTVQAKVWEELTTVATSWLEEAAGRLRSGSHRPDYQSQPGWFGKGRHAVHGTDVSIPEEDTVTDALVRICEDMRSGLPPRDPIRSLQLYVADQRPRRGDLLGARSHPTDIRIASLLYDFLDLRIEAKRLLGGSHMTSYAGPDGLGRFGDAIAYTDGPVGMMLGYSFRHDDRHWHRLLDEQLERSGKHPAEVVAVGEGRMRATLVDRAPTPVLVMHVLLNLDSSPSARQLDEQRRTSTSNRRSGKVAEASGNAANVSARTAGTVGPTAAGRARGRRRREP